MPISKTDLDCDLISNHNAHDHDHRNPVPITYNHHSGVIGETVIEQHEVSILLTDDTNNGG